MRALALLPLVIAAPAAADTFEATAERAQRIGRIEGLVWALTASCDTGDDTQQRQCRRVRDARAAELAGATLLVEGDKDAFEVGEWSPQRKSVPVVLTACIRCAGVEVDGKTYYVVTGKDGTPSARILDGKLAGARVYDTAKQFPEEAAAKAFAGAVSNARVQFLVRVPAKPRTQVAGKPVIALDLVGYRVVSTCDGSVVVASPASGPTQPDRSQCGAIAPGNPDAPEVDQLTAATVAQAMQPVVDAANACFERLGVAGKAKLKLTVASDGAVISYDQQGDFVGTPTGRCIDAAMKNASFPRSKKAKTMLSFPLTLQ